MCGIKPTSIRECLEEDTGSREKRQRTCHLSCALSVALIMVTISVDTKRRGGLAISWQMHNVNLNNPKGNYMKNKTNRCTQSMQQDFSGLWLNFSCVDAALWPGQHAVLLVGYSTEPLGKVCIFSHYLILSS